MIKRINRILIKFSDGTFKEYFNPRVIKKDNKIILQDRKYPDYFVEFVPEINYDNDN